MPNILNMLIGIAISLPISVALILWMLHYKKERRFPKGAVWLMLLAGAIACIPPILVGYGVDIIGGGVAKMLMGPEGMTEGGAKVPAGTQILSAAINAFLMAALLEEVMKFVGVSVVSKKRDSIQNRFDAVLCGAIVGIGFQILEDALYVDPAAGMLTTVVRALTPFHFTFGALMGLFFAEAKATGRKGYYVLAIVIPFLLHGVYDFASDLISLNDFTLVLFMIAMLGMIAFTIVLMVKIHKWSKSEKMLAPLDLYRK